MRNPSTTNRGIRNKIPLKRDASGPEGYSDTSGLRKNHLSLEFEICLQHLFYWWVVLRIVHCLVSMLKKLRQVVCGLTLQWSRGVHLNPKEYHVAAVS